MDLSRPRMTLPLLEDLLILVWRTVDMSIILSWIAPPSALLILSVLKFGERS
jgi:hypothetical protein